MAYTYYKAYEFNEAYVQTVGTEQTGDATTDTITTDSAHGLAVGDVIVFTALGGTTGVSLATRYFVQAVPLSTTLKVATTYSGGAVTVGSATDIKFKPLVATRIYWANQATHNPNNTTYTWEGDAQTVEINLMRGLTVPIALDAIPASAHAAIFAKTAITDTALPGGTGSSPKGYGGGNDKSGVSAGLLLKGSAVKTTDGADTTVTLTRWFPRGTITLTQPANLQTGQKFGTTGYSFAALRTTTDVLGGAIAGGSSDGEFYIDYELA